MLNSFGGIMNVDGINLGDMEKALEIFDSLESEEDKQFKVRETEIDLDKLFERFSLVGSSKEVEDEPIDCDIGLNLIDSMDGLDELLDGVYSAEESQFTYETCHFESVEPLEKPKKHEDSKVDEEVDEETSSEVDEDTESGEEESMDIEETLEDDIEEEIEDDIEDALDGLFDDEEEEIDDEDELDGLVDEEEDINEEESIEDEDLDGLIDEEPDFEEDEDELDGLIDSDEDDIEEDEDALDSLFDDEDEDIEEETSSVPEKPVIPETQVAKAPESVRAEEVYEDDIEEDEDDLSGLIDDEEDEEDGLGVLVDDVEEEDNDIEDDEDALDGLFDEEDDYTDEEPEQEVYKPAPQPVAQQPVVQQTPPQPKPQPTPQPEKLAPQPQNYIHSRPIAQYKPVENTQSLSSAGSNPSGATKKLQSSMGVKTSSQNSKSTMKQTVNSRSKQREKGVNESPINLTEHDMYSYMEIDKLYEIVKQFMLANGVRTRQVDIQLLLDKFGKDSIKKLIQKGYIIKLGKGVTTGR